MINKNNNNVELFKKACKSAKEKFDVDLIPLSRWLPLEESNVWFSEFHFGNNSAFSLPFIPQEYVYSDVFEIPINKNSHIQGYYKRGVKKYINLVRNNKTIPPITFIWRNNNWCMEDGNHRYHAHVLAEKNTINAIFAYPIKEML